MKRKISFEKIGKYLREISVVVIGVAITLSASYWITNRNEKKDMALYLNAIKLELEENIKTLHQHKEFLQKEVEYANYLKSNDKKAINLDTILINYGRNIWSVQRPPINIYAFEMFKLSGTMRLIKDKELLLSLWKTYNILDITKNSLFEEGSQAKGVEMKQEMSLILQAQQEQKLVTIPMYNYYVNTFWSDDMLRSCIGVLELLEEVVSKFE